MHLDVRPALDSPQAFMDRVYMQLRWMGVLGQGRPQNTITQTQSNHAT